jgi:GTP-binding protein
MLLNAITGQQRAIVSDIPGTTRDALDTLLTLDDRSILLIDTAGIRRRGSIDPGIEKYSVLRSVRAIDRADVAVLMMDTMELATAQDAHIAKYILDAYKGIVLVVNKWDMASEAGLTKAEATRLVMERFKFVPYAPICFTSGLKKTGIQELLDTCEGVFQQWSKGVPRYDLRRTVMNAVAEHPPTTSGKGGLKIYSVAQDNTGPPSFVFYVNRSDLLHFSYQRYLENALRRAYEFKGSPLKMEFRGRRKK